MSSILLVLPILLPVIFAVIGIALANHVRCQKWLAMMGSSLMVVSSLFLTAKVIKEEMLVLNFGNWPAPWGISFVADYLGASMVLVSAIVFWSTVYYSLFVTRERLIKKYYFPLKFFLMMGVNGAFLTGDIFNLYVWFEVMLIASFVLMVMGGTKPQLEGGFKYVVINIFASFIFLTGIGLIYGKVGSLNMAEIARVLVASEDSTSINTSIVLLIFAFGVKSGVFPLFFWLPASYHTLSTPVVALFAGLLTKVGVYSYMRAFTLFFNVSADLFSDLLLVIAALTMVVGVLGAASKFDIKRILSFHIISQIGYILFGIALFTQYAIAAALFYTLHHIVVKSNLFLVGGIIETKTGTTDLKHAGGLYRLTPWLAILFAIPAMSLGGIPPLSGFWAKLVIIDASIDASQLIVALVAVVVGIFTLYSMTKIWAEVFWKNKPDEGDNEVKLPKPQLQSPWIPSILLASITLVIGFYPETLLDYCKFAADQLMNPEVYIERVLSK